MTTPTRIFEAVVTTLNRNGDIHISPMGVRHIGEDVILMPYLPSTTYDNIMATSTAVLNLTTDPCIFAGCVTGRNEWPTQAADQVVGVRLRNAIEHLELRLARVEAHDERPALHMACVHRVNHGGFRGMNRAQAAVIEGAILVSRLGMLPREKVLREMDYLQVAIDKTAGPPERTAWGWLREAADHHYARESSLP